MATDLTYSTTGAGSGNSSTASVTGPSTTDGDVLAVVVNSLSGRSVSSWSGFATGLSSVRSDDYEGSRLSIAWIECDGTETGSITANMSGSGEWWIQYVLYTGAAADTKTVVSPTAYDTEADASDGVSVGLTAAAGDAAFVAAGNVYSDAGWTGSGGLTEASDSNEYLATYYETGLSAGSTGHSVTFGDNTEGHATAVLFRTSDAGGGGGDPTITNVARGFVHRGGGGTNFSIDLSSDLSAGIDGGDGSIDDGDLLLVQMMVDQDDLTAITQTAGSTLTQIHYDETTAGRDRGSALFYRECDGTEDSSTLTFEATGDLNEERSIAAVVYRGVDQTTPFDVTWNTSNHYTEGQNNYNGTPDAITTVTDEALVVIFQTITHDDITTAGAPSGYNIVLDGTGSTVDHRQQFVVSKQVDTAGTETPGAFTHSVNNTVSESQFRTIALRPAAGTTHALTAPVLSSTSTFPAATVTLNRNLSAPILDSSSSFPSATVTIGHSLSAPVLASPVSFPSATVTIGHSLSAPVLASPVSFPSATVTIGTTLFAPVLDSPATFPAASVTLDRLVSAPVLASSTSFPAATVTVNRNLAAPVLSSTSSFPSATISVGKNLSAPVLASSVSFPGATVTVNRNLAAPVLSSSSSFPSATVTLGKPVSAPLLESTVTFPGATVTLNRKLVAPVLDSPATFPAAALTIGANLAAPVLASPVSFPSATVTLNRKLVAPVLASSTSFPAASVTLDRLVSAPVLDSSSSFPASTVTLNRKVAAPVLSSTSSFPSATVTLTSNVSAPVLSSSSSFPSATVTLDRLVSAPVLDSPTSFPGATVTLNRVLVAPVLDSPSSFPGSDLAIVVGTRGIRIVGQPGSEASSIITGRETTVSRIMVSPSDVSARGIIGDDLTDERILV